MNIALYAHGGSGNHGCEALVRSTILAIGTEGNQYTVFSERPQDDNAVVCTQSGVLGNHPAVQESFANRD